MREGMLAEVWRKHSEQATDLRCEDVIPEKERVEPDTKLIQRCYFKPTKDHPAYDEYSSSDERYPDTLAVDLVIQAISPQRPMWD